MHNMMHLLRRMIRTKMNKSDQAEYDRNRGMCVGSFSLNEVILEF